MSGAVVFIVFLVGTFSAVQCLERESCKRHYQMKKIGKYTYCYRMHVIDNSVNITTADEDHCQKTSDFSTITSISIRNKEEYELVKMLYRSFHTLVRPIPLLLGLTYKNGRFHWFDRAPFNFSDFLGVGYKSHYSLYKKGNCRRIFLHSRIIHRDRKYYTFDVDCKAQFRQYFVLCRYQLPESTTPSTLLRYHKVIDEPEQVPSSISNK